MGNVYALARLKRVWYSPEQPATISVRPASSVGIVMARVKCNLGLAMLWWGLGHLSDAHPTKVVGRSALSVVREQLHETPHGSFIRMGPGPRIYPGELALVGALLGALAFGVSTLLYVFGVINTGVPSLLRLDVVDPLILHRHEIRTIRQTRG